MTFDVTAVGTLNVDIIVAGQAPTDVARLNQWVEPSALEIGAAGSVGYCAIDLARLGLSVNMLSSVADDLFGRWIRESLAREGIGTEDVTVEPGASGIGLYLLLFGSKKRPLTGRLATHPPWPLTLTAAAEARLAASRLLHCSGYLHYPQVWGEPTARLYKKAKTLGLTTSLDPQFPFEPVTGSWLPLFGDLLRHVDLLFVDEVEAKAISGEDRPEAAARRLLEMGPRLVAVKLGAEGAILADRDRLVRQAPFPADAISDSIGAGDAFDAGVISGTLRGLGLLETARFASAAACLSLRGMGGTQAAPSSAEVEKFLAGVPGG